MAPSKGGSRLIASKKNIKSNLYIVFPISRDVKVMGRIHNKLVVVDNILYIGDLTKILTLFHLCFINRETSLDNYKSYGGSRSSVDGWFSVRFNMYPNAFNKIHIDSSKSFCQPWVMIGVIDYSLMLAYWNWSNIGSIQKLQHL